MTRIPFDQFAKQFLDEFLTPLGKVEKSLEVLGESKLVDIYFAPSAQPTVNPKILGLLGRLAATPCLFEPFRNPPTATEVRDCILKLFWVHSDLQRQAHREQRRILEAELPRLWILASSASASLLKNFAATPNDTWLPGIYLMGESFKSAIICINQLPQTQETLWLRLLGKGTTQEQAITQLLDFPRDEPSRTKALRLLANWKITLETSKEIDKDEQGLIMMLSQAYLEWERETERRGIQTERTTTIENLLKARFGSLDEELTGIIPILVEFSIEKYTSFLLQLPQLSREELLTRFGNK
ncbi:MAG: flagellar assembly protein H [Iphinoe sp. HA4291-MV1]|jgi:hypothetical protein|nr:flagellar assembly protein H [Iphinoe sp. HA4291-MV1]